MRKHWKSKVNREGVSPVIATILMVAITVVLSSVLVGMVMEMSAEPEPVLNVEAVFIPQDGWVAMVTYAPTSLDVNDVWVAFIHTDNKYHEVYGDWDSSTLRLGSTFYPNPKALNENSYPHITFPIEVSFFYKGDKHNTNPGKKLATIVFDF